MDDKKALYQVVDYILNHATTAELEVISEALKRRHSSQRPDGFNPRAMAENMARTVNDQLGASLDVVEISRKIVADMIREKEPQISEEELQVLLDRWLPSTQTEEQPETLPPDVLLTMIGQFLQARQGRLPPEEQKELPDDWQTRYWKIFPENSQQLIQEHLDGRIDEVRFWERIIRTLH